MVLFRGLLFPPVAGSCGFSGAGAEGAAADPVRAWQADVAGGAAAPAASQGDLSDSGLGGGGPAPASHPDSSHRSPYSCGTAWRDRGQGGPGAEAEDATVIACTGACAAAGLKSEEDDGVPELACAAEELAAPGLLAPPPCFCDASCYRRLQRHRAPFFRSKSKPV